MMKLSLFIMFFTTLNYSIAIKLPDAKTLKERLKKRSSCKDFIKKTQLIQQLSNQLMEPSCVFNKIEEARRHYEQNLHLEGTKFVLSERQHRDIFLVIMQDYPDGIFEIYPHLENKLTKSEVTFAAPKKNKNTIKKFIKNLSSSF